MLKISSFITIYLLISALIIFIYFKYNLHFDEKYKVLIDLSIALVGFLTIYSLLLQANYNNINEKNQEASIYKDVLTETFNTSLDDFINNNMEYYYNELFNNIKPNDSNRNPIREEIITFKMLSSYSNYASYFESSIKLSDYKKLLEKHNVRVINTLKVLLKSDTFKKYLNKYLNTIAGPPLIKYMKKYLDYTI